MTTIIECPIAACPWTLAAGPPGVPAGLLADIFGPGVMAAQAMADHFEKTERNLRDHFSTHRLEEWVGEITRLRDAAAGPRQRPGDQPAPVPNDGPSMHDLVADDVRGIAMDGRRL